jgi:UV DNA damage endonuclease
MIKKTFLSKGIDYASELSLLNVVDLIKIIQWNEDNGINFFRLSSNIFPWASEYSIRDLTHYLRIKHLLEGVGNLTKKYDHRITFHPGPFNVLVSPNEKVVQNTIKDLSTHGEIFDLMGLSRTPYNKINIHCNGVYGDKISAMDRFCKNFELLPDSVKTRLTVENDDKASMYSVKDLMYIHERIGIPIVFDYHHHKFCTGGLTEQEALEMAISTWPKDITPVVHYSESKSLHENNDKIKPQAHSDLINKMPNTFGYDVDVMVEAKSKELSILSYLNVENTLLS